MGRVLIADTPDLHEELSACFPGEAVTCVTTLEAARQALSGTSFTLILVGLHFDGLRMFDLLAETRKGAQPIPILCVKARPSFLSHDMQASLEAAVKVLGGRAFLDLSDADTAARCAVIRNLVPELHGA